MSIAKLTADSLPPALSEDDHQALLDLYVRGTPENTVRAYERDLVYLTAWREARFGMPLVFPESAEVCLAFILDHSRDLGQDKPGSAALEAARAMVAMGLRKSVSAPAPATLDRRIASWRTFHRMKNLASPFDDPGVRQARIKARRAAAHRPERKSANPVTRDILLQILNACGEGITGLRDRALLMTAWSSGGRRRSEVAGLRASDVDLREFDDTGIIRLRLRATKTMKDGVPDLVLTGSAARTLRKWMSVANIVDGALFRAISKSGGVQARGLSGAGVAFIFRQALKRAGLPPDHASPHGLRSGFLTQAALDGVPVQAAMRLSLHRSVSQAMDYYDDVDVASNPAVGLLDARRNGTRP